MMTPDTKRQDILDVVANIRSARAKLTCHALNKEVYQSLNGDAGALEDLHGGPIMFDMLSASEKASLKSEFTTKLVTTEMEALKALRAIVEEKVVQPIIKALLFIKNAAQEVTIDIPDQPSPASPDAEPGEPFDPTKTSEDGEVVPGVEEGEAPEDTPVPDAEAEVIEETTDVVTDVIDKATELLNSSISGEIARIFSEAEEMPETVQQPDAPDPANPEPDPVMNDPDHVVFSPDGDVEESANQLVGKLNYIQKHVGFDVAEMAIKRAIPAARPKCTDVVREKVIASAKKLRASIAAFRSAVETLNDAIPYWTSTVEELTKGPDALFQATVKASNFTTSATNLIRKHIKYLGYFCDANLIDSVSRVLSE